MEYELVPPATLLKRMCKTQRIICEEFIEAEGREAFNRVVSLVNTIANVQSPTNKIMILDETVFIQAVYKIVLLAQGMKKDPGAAEFEFNVIWKGITPARRQYNPVVLAPMPADNKTIFCKRKRAKKAVSTENVQEAAD